MPCDVEIAPSLWLRVPFRVRTSIPSADPRTAGNFCSLEKRNPSTTCLGWEPPAVTPPPSGIGPSIPPHPPREIVRQMIRPPKRPATFPRPPRDREPPRADRFRRMGPVLGRSQKACTRCNSSCAGGYFAATRAKQSVSSCLPIRDGCSASRVGWS